MNRYFDSLGLVLKRRCWATYQCELLGGNLGTGSQASSFVGNYFSPSSSTFVTTQLDGSISADVNIGCTSSASCVAAGQVGISPTGSAIWTESGGQWSLTVDQLATDGQSLNAVSCWSGLDHVDFNTGGQYVVVQDGV